MDVILIPGMWLRGSSWDEVVPALEEAGHRARPITLPGLGSRRLDRSRISLRDHVDEVVDVIDSYPLGTRLALVGHSAGAAVAHAAVDARSNRVAHVVYVAGEPRGEGEKGGDWTVEGGEVPLPEWSTFPDEMLAGLDAERLAAMREDSVPTPAGVVTDPLRLTGNARRYDVPATLICTDYSSREIRELVAQDVPEVRELGRINQVSYVDLPTGHWPQYSRPVDLARAIAAAIA